MMSFRNIATISHFETKVLWRNWFFRIVALIGVIFLTIFNIAVFSEADTPRWFQLSNSWMMPYSAMLMISIPQVAAVIFLATGLIKKDKKIDTNEVFFVRPVTNVDYVFGKALAMFKLFMLLNLFLLCIPFVVNLTNPYSDLNPAAFIFYPLLTTLPSIVFTTGLAFFVVTLLKNQPITIVLLIGVAGVQIIYYFDKFSNILDFTSFRLPLLVSEMVGFVDFEFALQQRLFYFLTGIALLFLTAFFLDRLSSHKRTKLLTGIIGMALICTSSYIMYDLWKIRLDGIDKRKEMILVNNQWAEKQNVDVLSHSIELSWLGESISSNSEMVVKNNTSQPLEEIYFTLNPTLKVTSVEINEKPSTFSRQLQIVILNEGISLSPGEEIKIRLSYSGKMDESLAYLEVDQDRYESANDYFMYSLQKKYSFLQSDYLLLTKDVFWYPVAELGYNQVIARKEATSFVNFQLKVISKPGMLPISQGKYQKLDENIYHFIPEYPLPHVSLVIGNYLRKEIELDSITYSVFHYPDNDYFLNQLNQLGDTLGFLIKDLVNEYEDAQQLEYPFKRLQFVEAPIQFNSYNSIYESHQAYLQPETVLWPEEGGSIRHFDFRRQMRDMNRQSRDQNSELTEKQKQANVFNDLIKNIFTKQVGSNWFFDGRESDEPDYSLYPNYYDFNSGILNEKWPLFNQNIATYLRNDKQTQNDFSRNINGISFAEECNMLMQELILEEIIKQEDFSKIQKSLSLKSQYLFAYLGYTVGETELKRFLFRWINDHQHQLTSYDSFSKAFSSHFNMDIDPIIQKVFFDTRQPAFEILDFQKYEVLDGDRKRYQIVLQIKNSGENDGVLNVKFSYEENSLGGRFRRNRPANEENQEDPGHLTVIKQGEIKMLGYLLDARPSEVIVNTIISQNIPSEIALSVGTIPTRKNIELFTGEKVIASENVPDQLEIIVDNEDPGFTTFSPVKPTYLRAYLDSRNSEEQEYFGEWSRPYAKWLPTTGSDFYGKVVRSAHFTRAGGGEKTATWEPELEEAGFYDVYVYMRGKNQKAYRGRDEENKQLSYYYIINHSDGTDEIKYNISNAEPGWNYLGSYYFEQSDASISLTDQCELRIVYADAIKWVKQ